MNGLISRAQPPTKYQETRPRWALKLPMAPLRLRIEGQRFRDTENREVTLRGINVAGDAKFPTNPDLPSNNPDRFYEGDDLSFVGRPFSIDEAHTHFSRLKRWGVQPHTICLYLGGY